MSDEFGNYIEEEDNLHVSDDSGYIIVWGEKTDGEINLLGLSYESSYLWDNKLNDIMGKKINAVQNLSDLLGLPLFWVGKEDFENKELEIDVIKNNLDDFEPSRFHVNEANDQIQGILGTDYEVSGASKEVNVSLADAYHKWTRNFLPSKYVKIDIDILAVNNENRPTGFIEIKRTGQAPNRWTPWKDDLENYMIQFQTSCEANLKPIIIHHQYVERNKLGEINDESDIGYYKIKDMNPKGSPWMDYDKEIITASEARERLNNL